MNTGGVSNTQPTGFDQWAGFYDRYYVAASKIRITGFNLDTTDTVVATLLPSDELLAVANVATIKPARQTYSISKMVGPLATSGSKFTMKHYMTTNKNQGKRGCDIDDNYQGTMSATGGSSPNEKWYWCIFFENGIGTNFVHVQFKVTITYYVKCFSRRTPDYSTAE